MQMATPQKKVALHVHEGIDFFAHETSINFSPNQFVVDFKNLTPRIDPRSGSDPIVFLRHNVILLEPLHAKKLAELLTDVVKKYEKEFGKIEKTKAQTKYEKKLKRKTTKNKKPKTGVTPTYFG
jgi:hypothetical protein